METPLKENIRIFPDHEAASRSAASLFLKFAGESMGGRGTFSVALSGGATPIRMFNIIGSEYADAVQWDRVHVFWADERCVPADSGDSNFGIAYELFLSQVSIPDGNIHRIRGEGDPSKEAIRYEQEIRAAFPSGLPAFDLVILGMGMDGHTASLFPDTDAAGETERLVTSSYGGQHRGWRITLTLPVLNNAKNIFFLVTGSEKAGIVARVLGESEERESLPAGLVNPVKGKLIWFLDESSARKLTMRKG